MKPITGNISTPTPSPSPPLDKASYEDVYMARHALLHKETEERVLGMLL